jgi:hypothetical protein
LPFEVTSRYLEGFFELNDHDCTYYISKATTDASKITKICTTYSFSNLNHVKFFLAATYYGGQNLTDLQTKTTLTSAETDALFNATDPDSFQSAYTSVL